MSHLRADALAVVATGLALSIGCGGATARPVVPAGEVGDADQEPAATGEETPQPVAAAPAPVVEPREVLPRVVLWCSTPTGTACAQAAASLGVEHTEVSRIPKVLLEGFQDLPDDCLEPGIARLALQLSQDLSIPQDMWVDQAGGDLAREDIHRVSYGGGCVTGADASIPAVKIHTQPMAGGNMFLVRVWEPGEV